MLPFLSMAIEPIHRLVESGEYVACWNTEKLPVGAFLSSYHRTPATWFLTLPPAFTEWLTTRVSWSPKLRYASRYIRRSASESSFWRVPGSGMQVPPLPPRVYDATGMLVGPLSEEFALLIPSTWNLSRA